MHGMQEVSGSIPLFSTKKSPYFIGSTVIFFLLKPIFEGCIASPAPFLGFCRRFQYNPQRLTLRCFQKRMFAARFTEYIPSAVPSSSCPFFRRSVLPRCFLPRRSASLHSSLALLPAASHIQTGFLRCAVPVPAGFIFRYALPCSFLLICFNPRPAHPARIPAGGSGGRHFR